MELGKTLEEQVWDQLRLCYDYEIPVNIVELGLIYGFKIENLPEGGNSVEVRMTFTSPMCPMGDLIKKDVERRVATVAQQFRRDVGHVSRLRVQVDDVQAVVVLHDHGDVFNIDLQAAHGATPS